MKAQVRWQGDKAFLDALRNAARQGVRDAAVEAVGRAAIDVQARMREHLDRLVYMQPPAASGYQRTGRLRRSTHAARPDADHSGDHGAALTSDLAADDPRHVAAPVQRGVASEVGAYADYAGYVAEGAQGVAPRPFVEQTIPDAEDALERRMREYVERWIARL